MTGLGAGSDGSAWIYGLIEKHSGDDLTEAAPWFEPPSPRREGSEHFPYYQQFGGVRERLA